MHRSIARYVWLASLARTATMTGYDQVVTFDAP
jgi:hypothetical protein